MMKKTKGVYTHFEHMDSSASIGKMTVYMLLIYHPLPSRQNRFKHFTFFIRCGYINGSELCYSKSAIFV